MRVSPKFWKWLGLSVCGAVLLVAAIRAWVVPAWLVRQIEASTGGRAEVKGWWLNGRSAGVVGLVLREGTKAGAPVWASAERVATDLTLGGLLRGRTTPRKITLTAPRIALRFDRDGAVLTKIGGGGGPAASLPLVVANDGALTIAQEGRPPMVVTQLVARLASDGDALSVAIQSNDANWGPLQATGRFDRSFRTGRIEMKTTKGLSIDRQKAERIPFVPSDVWANVVPDGPVDIALTVELGQGAARAIRVRTVVGLRETSVRSPALDLSATKTTGRVVVEGRVVRIENVRGRAIGGTVEANGTLDFNHSPPRFDLGLQLEQINVADAPRRWQLYEAGVTGRLTGRARLRVSLAASGVDLSGSSGEAVVRGGSIQGIPVKSLRLVMRAEGNDLQFESDEKSDSAAAAPEKCNHKGTKNTKTATKKTGTTHFSGDSSDISSSLCSRFSFPRSAWECRPGRSASLPARPILPQSGKDGIPTRSVGTRNVLIPGLIALLPPPAKDDAEKAAKPEAGIKLPESITTKIELEDVDMNKLIKRAEFLLGFPFPLPVSGKLSLKASATIPLGQLRDLKGYAFHGDLTLKGASLDKVDLGHLAARIDLADGVLELKHLRGRLVDRPEGGPDNPPEEEAPVAAEGPLPPRGFRGNLRAVLSPPGALEAHFEGVALPLGELAAPALPRPTPVAGLVNISADARVDLGKATDPAAWNVSGQAESERITYQGSQLDRISFGFRLENAHLDVRDLAAQLRGQPLSARVALDLKPPRAFDAKLDVTGWDLTTLLALIPTAPHPSPVSGLLTAHATARGTLSPRQVVTHGEGRLGKFQAGPVPLGDVPFQWDNEADSIVVSILDAHPFGGRLAARARVPTVAGKPTVGAANVEGIDTAQIAAAMPDSSLKLTGRASGRVDFSIPADVSAVVANVQVTAPDLTIQGLPARDVRVSLGARKGSLHYELTAESLGGKVKFTGDVPLTAAPGRAALDGEVRFVGFTMEDLWKSLPMTGMVAKLGGRGAVDANIRLPRDGSGLWAHGIAEFRDLMYGADFPLGQLRGTVALTPTSWRVDPLTGDLLGGTAEGALWGRATAKGPDPRLGFELQVDRVPMKRVLTFVPKLAGSLEGFGTLRLVGQLGDNFRATADVELPHGKLAGLPLSELRAPAELVYTPSTGMGVLQVRRWSTRLAGGRVQGDTSFHLGQDRAFRADVQLTELDLETLARLESDARHPASGRISGRIVLNGSDPAITRHYRGKVNLDLDDASLVALPVFRELDRFLGSARGGVFEDGDLIGTIANRQLIVEMLTLEGRLVQMHATGTIGFDGPLNLEVLINTNQIISQTGQALVAAIPGLNNLAGRRDEASSRVANYFSNRLLKLRVTGTVRNPSINTDPGIIVAESAVGFFAGVLKLPFSFLR